MTDITWEKTHEDERGRWNEYKNSITGESSIKEHTLKVVWKSCNKNEHDFEMTGNREVTCLKCGQIQNFLLGIEKFEDGKIVQI